MVEPVLALADTPVAAEVAVSGLREEAAPTALAVAVVVAMVAVTVVEVEVRPTLRRAR
jgi:hypothetical protein